MENKTYGNCIITKAVIFAAEKHHGTIRKGSEENPLPYIVHPMEAATIAATMTNAPNVIASAFLHDLVEDTDVSIETIKAEFNDIIAELVAGETENKRAGEPPGETWGIRKQETLDFLKHADENSKIITLSDKLSNIRALKQVPGEGDKHINE